MAKQSLDDPRREPPFGHLGTFRARGHTSKRPFFLPLTAFVLALLALYLATQYPYTLHLPFAGDDFVFLDRTRNASFLSLWKTSEGGYNVLAWHYYRPISRELHYWVLTRAFGMWEPPFHLASMILVAIVGTLYFVLVRGIAGTAVAAVATAAVMALAAWGVLVVWAAGSQDLWMMAFAVATLLALARGRPRLAWIGLALALLSKETAATLPAIALAYLLAIERRTWRDALSRTSGLWIMVTVWAAFHPLLGGQLRHPIHEPTLPGLRHSVGWILGHSLLAVVNLESWPRPAVGWPVALGTGLVGALILGALIAVGLRRLPRLAPLPAPDPARAGTGRVVLWGSSWALLAWAPLLMPSLGWHAYYAMFGMLGAWVALAALLTKRPMLALAVVATLAVLRSGRASTRSSDWGNESFQKRAALFGRETREYFFARYPSLPLHSRIYLAEVPPQVGLVPGGEDSPAFRVWYRDSTLGTYFASRYRPRRAGEPPGRDYFFVYDSTAGWQEDAIVTLPEHPSADQREAYATFMWRLSQFPAARAQYELLVAAAPQRWDYAFNLGSALLKEGDSVSAARWYQRAAELPGATEAIRRTAERSRRFLPP